MGQKPGMMPLQPLIYCVLNTISALKEHVSNLLNIQTQRTKQPASGWSQVTAIKPPVLTPSSIWCKAREKAGKKCAISKSEANSVLNLLRDYIFPSLQKPLINTTLHI